MARRVQGVVYISGGAQNGLVVVENLVGEGRSRAMGQRMCIQRRVKSDLLLLAASRVVQMNFHF